MVYGLSCQDLGDVCPYVAKGETVDEVLKDIAKHAKEVHGYTDEQLKDPKMMEEIKGAIKKV